ncbi:MAG TPA: MFS transporter [Longilinea sp.]|nr:MFS transporter [Longilinea sp.]
MTGTARSVQAGPVKLTVSYKVIWGLASLGASLIAGVFGALLPIFYQDYLGLQASWIAVASVVYAVWNALNDPVFGYITDNTRSKHGRRIPYMRYTAPFLALTFILVWFAPPKAGQEALFWWMLVSMVLYDGCYTIIGLVYSALLPEVTESDSERNKLQISSSLFGLLGTLLGFIIPDMFRPKVGMSPSFFPLQIAMIVLGIIGALLIVMTTLKVKERMEFTQVDKPLKVGDAIKYTFTSKSFLVLAAENFMAILVSSLVTGSLYYMADYVVNMPTIALLACIFVPLIIGVPLTDLIRKRLGVVGAQQLLLVIAGVGLIGVTFLPIDLIPIGLVVAGFGLAGPQTLTNVLFAEVADEDEIRTGVRREGAFFGINALITKPAQSIALALMPFVLQITHFVTREQNGGTIYLNQPAGAIFGIRAVVGLIPGIAMLVGALILIAFPLRGKHLEEQQVQVLQMHAQKKETLDAQG